jgi:hypothetical protein
MESRNIVQLPGEPLANRLSDPSNGGALERAGGNGLIPPSMLKALTIGPVSAARHLERFGVVHPGVSKFQEIWRGPRAST